MKDQGENRTAAPPRQLCAARPSTGQQDLTPGPTRLKAVAARTSVRVGRLELLFKEQRGQVCVQEHGRPRRGHDMEVEVQTCFSKAASKEWTGRALSQAPGASW